MGFDIPKDNKEWAKEQGLSRWCDEHKIWYNPMIGCPEHLKEAEAAKLTKSKELKDQGRQALEQFDLKFNKKKRWPWSK